jgi:hypothetical protein
MGGGYRTRQDCSLLGWNGCSNRRSQVYIGTSIFLIALGAILRYAVTANVEGINLDTAGLILMIVGAVGLLFSLLWMTIWADRRRDRVVATEPVARERVVDRDY